MVRPCAASSSARRTIAVVVMVLLALAGSRAGPLFLRALGGRTRRTLSGPALAGSSSAQLSTGFYSKSCPGVFGAVKSGMKSTIAWEKRMGASIVRLFFHDRFVQGCDASLLLDDASSFRGEKMATPNNGSVRGFEVIDSIKSAVEKICPGVVSCADILAIAARDSISILGGPSWDVKVGRRDSRTASFSGANNNIPPPTSGLANLTSLFAAQGLSQKDMVALSGSHTIGQAHCTNFRAYIYNETNIDGGFSMMRQSGCPSNSGSGDNNLAPLDLQTPTVFENNYYKILVIKKGLLHSNQEFFNGGATDSLVQTYVSSQRTFFADFVTGMIKMGGLKWRDQEELQEG